MVVSLVNDAGYGLSNGKIDPNGTCSYLTSNGPFGSFQIVDLDPGCSGKERRRPWDDGLRC
jgi:hypothetical protein